MAEIILDPDRGLQDQMREILDLSVAWERYEVQWNPRPNQPHGGVVVVPDSLAGRYESRAPVETEQAASKRRGGRAATGSGEDKA